MQIKHIHHIAIICSDYEKSKHFYTNIMGFEIVHEDYRDDRASYKLDLCLHGNYCIELFSFPTPPKRLSRPEAAGLRHLAFAVDDLEEWRQYLQDQDVVTEDIRTDHLTNKRFFFFFDPDDLPLELYEA